METAEIALEAELAAGVWTNLWPDVLASPPPRFSYGISGSGPLDLVARTGNLTFSLKNGEDNSAGLLGYYAPGNPNARPGWGEGIRTRMKFTYAGTAYYKFLGRLSGVDVEPGRFAQRKAHAEALDWMDIAASQKLSQLPIETDKRVDQLLTSALAVMPIQPRATDFDTGIETLARCFDSDADSKTTFLSLFGKLCRNDLGGRIYLRGDTTGGETLCFESRRARLFNTTPIVALADNMRELKVSYDREAIRNLIRVRIFPKRVDESEVVIHDAPAPVPISPGQTVTLTLPYRDPDTGQEISATDVVWPLEADTDFKFGANQGDYGELNSSLAFVETIGGNSARLEITNSGTTPGWLNKLQLRGKGIYAYDPQTIEASDPGSIDIRGERVLTWDLTQHDSQTKAEALASFLKLTEKDPRRIPSSVRFLANSTPALMTAALAGEPGACFSLLETVTGIDSDLFINGVSFEIEGGKWIWCEWTPAPVYSLPIWTIGVSRLGVTPAECVPVL